MVLQNYQILIKMTSNTISIVAFSGGLKCLRKIHFNTQSGVQGGPRGQTFPQTLAGIEAKPSHSKGLELLLASPDF